MEFIYIIIKGNFFMSIVTTTERIKPNAFPRQSSTYCLKVSLTHNNTEPSDSKEKEYHA